MPKKHRGTYRLSAAIAFGFLLMASSLSPGCGRPSPESKTIPPTLHKLTDIGIRESGDLLAHTPTAVASPESDRIGDLIDDTADNDKTEPIKLPPTVKKDPDNTAKKPMDSSTAPPKRGEFTIQIGAYVIEENLSLAKETVSSLGFVPYTAEITRKMKMFCIIVEEGKTEAEAHEIASMLSGKGLNPRLLSNDGNTVDVAGGIYYYRNEALDAEGRIRSLGHAAHVEERTVEVVLTCLRTGNYMTSEEAEKDLNTLKQKGFSPVILKSDQ
jgi:cell division septation protein DedD